MIDGILIFSRYSGTLLWHMPFTFDYGLSVPNTRNSDKIGTLRQTRGIYHRDEFNAAALFFALQHYTASSQVEGVSFNNGINSITVPLNSIKFGASNVQFHMLHDILHVNGSRNDDLQELISGSSDHDTGNVAPVTTTVPSHSTSADDNHCGNQATITNQTNDEHASSSNKHTNIADVLPETWQDPMVVLISHVKYAQEGLKLFSTCANLAVKDMVSSIETVIDTQPSFQRCLMKHLRYQMNYTVPSDCIGHLVNSLHQHRCMLQLDKSSASKLINKSDLDTFEREYDEIETPQSNVHTTTASKEETQQSNVHTTTTSKEEETQQSNVHTTTTSKEEETQQSNVHTTTTTKVATFQSNVHTSTLQSNVHTEETQQSSVHTTTTKVTILQSNGRTTTTKKETLQSNVHTLHPKADQSNAHTTSKEEETQQSNVHIKDEIEQLHEPNDGRKQRSVLVNQDTRSQASTVQMMPHNDTSNNDSSNNDTFDNDTSNNETSNNDTSDNNNSNNDGHDCVSEMFQPIENEIDSQYVSMTEDEQPVQSQTKFDIQISDTQTITDCSDKTSTNSSVVSMLSSSVNITQGLSSNASVQSKRFRHDIHVQSSDTPTVSNTSHVNSSSVKVDMIRSPRKVSNVSDTSNESYSRTVDVCTTSTSVPQTSGNVIDPSPRIPLNVTNDATQNRNSQVLMPTLSNNRNKQESSMDMVNTFIYNRNEGGSSMDVVNTSNNDINNQESSMKIVNIIDNQKWSMDMMNYQRTSMDSTNASVSASTSIHETTSTSPIDIQSARLLQTSLQSNSISSPIVLPTSTESDTVQSSNSRSQLFIKNHSEQSNNVIFVCAIPYISNTLQAIDTFNESQNIGQIVQRNWSDWVQFNECNTQDQSNKFNVPVPPKESKKDVSIRRRGRLNRMMKLFRKKNNQPNRETLEHRKEESFQNDCYQSKLETTYMESDTNVTRQWVFGPMGAGQGIPANYRNLSFPQLSSFQTMIKTLQMEKNIDTDKITIAATLLHIGRCAAIDASKTYHFITMKSDPCSTDIDAQHDDAIGHKDCCIQTSGCIIKIPAEKIDQIGTLAGLSTSFPHTLYCFMYLAQHYIIVVHLDDDSVQKNMYQGILEPSVKDSLNKLDATLHAASSFKYKNNKRKH